MVDQHGKLLLANPVPERMFDYERNGILGLVGFHYQTKSICLTDFSGPATLGIWKVLGSV